jgi:hypothetical protein
MYEEMGRAMLVMAVFAVVGVVLGIWKFIEIIIWIMNHIKIV